MQFDLFHAYTVDEHTIRVLLKLESFADDNQRPHHPLCVDLFPRLGHSGTYCWWRRYFTISPKGAAAGMPSSAPATCWNSRRYTICPPRMQLVAWLVENHLVMSVTAQRRDIQDPDVLVRFAGEM